MGQLGMGVMLRMLTGNADSAAVFSGSIGKVITALSLGDDDALHFEFSDGTKMRLFDDGQSCCESRYMRTDDDLSYFVGSTLIDAEIKKAPNMPDEWGDHEVQFLEVKTSKGCFTMASHNEHNGYYGGFSVIAALE
jgi:hypothetical protein